MTQFKLASNLGDLFYVRHFLYIIFKYSMYQLCTNYQPNSMVDFSSRVNDVKYLISTKSTKPVLKFQIGRVQVFAGLQPPLGWASEIRQNAKNFP